MTKIEKNSNSFSCKLFSTTTNVAYKQFNIIGHNFLPKVFLTSNLVTYPFEKTPFTHRCISANKYIIGVRSSLFILNGNIFTKRVLEMQQLFLRYYLGKKFNYTNETILFITEHFELKDYFLELEILGNIKLLYGAAPGRPGILSNWAISSQTLLATMNYSKITNMGGYQKKLDFIIVIGVTSSENIISEIQRIKTKAITFGMHDIAIKKDWEGHFTFPGNPKSLATSYFICNLIFYCLQWAKHIHSQK